VWCRAGDCLLRLTSPTRRALFNSLRSCDRCYSSYGDGVVVVEVAVDQSACFNWRLRAWSSGSFPVDFTETGRCDVGLVIRRNLGKSSAELLGCQAVASASTFPLQPRTRWHLTRPPRPDLTTQALAMSTHAEQNPVSTCEFPSSPDPGRVLGIPHSPNFGGVIRGQRVGHCEPNHQTGGSQPCGHWTRFGCFECRSPQPSVVLSKFPRPIGGRREGRWTMWLPVAPCESWRDPIRRLPAYTSGPEFDKRPLCLRYSVWLHVLAPLFHV
jgi:hypothetical protein